MDSLQGRDIYFITRDILRILDPRVINHGNRTAYILYKMLNHSGKYETGEMAKLCLIGAVHDIGVYKTDYLSDMLRYESRDSMPHSIYGYLFIRFLTPLKDFAGIILHHHTDFNKLKKTSYYEVGTYLSVAERMDIYQNAMGSKFDHKMFQKVAGIKYSAEALELVYSVEKEYGIFAKINSGEYEKELEELFNNLEFTDEEIKGFLYGLMFCISFHNENSLKDVATCLNVSMKLGEELSLDRKSLDLLYCVAILHNFKIVSVPRKLTEEEKADISRYVAMSENLLGNSLEKDILKVSETISNYLVLGDESLPKDKESLLRVLSDDAGRGDLNSEVVRRFADSYDSIMDSVNVSNEEILSTYKRLEDNYKLTYKQITRTS